MDESGLALEFLELLMKGQRARADSVLYEIDEDELVNLQGVLWSARAMVLERRKLERIKGA